jgi:hypothetical protein
MVVFLFAVEIVEAAGIVIVVMVKGIAGVRCYGMV